MEQRPGAGPRGQTDAGAVTAARIEREAVRLFAAQGVDATSTRDIARAVGIADSAMYRHFKGKDDLVRTIFARHWGAYGRRLRDLADQGGTTAQRIDRMVRGICRLYDEDPDLFNFLLVVQHGQLRHVPAEAENPVSVLCAVIAQGVASGEVRHADPDLLAAMVVGAVVQPATFRLYGRLTKPFAAMEDEIAAACVRLVVPA